VTRRSSRAIALVAGAALLVTLLPAASQASPETLRRATGNILQAPLDVMLSPVIAGRTLVTNLRDIDDTTPVRVFYAVPGYVWLTGVQAGAGVLRGVAGCLELLPGIFLLPFETDIDPLFDPADRGAAIIEMENPLAENSVMKWVPLMTWNVRFGVTYTSAEY
jgi:hypothetical protein